MRYSLSLHDTNIVLLYHKTIGACDLFCKIAASISNIVQIEVTNTKFCFYRVAALALAASANSSRLQSNRGVHEPGGQFRQRLLDESNQVLLSIFRSLADFSSLGVPSTSFFDDIQISRNLNSPVLNTFSVHDFHKRLL